jgi:hypothetical protein
MLGLMPRDDLPRLGTQRKGNGMYRVTFNGTIVNILKDGACVSWEEVEHLLNRHGTDAEALDRLFVGVGLCPHCGGDIPLSQAERPPSGEMVMVPREPTDAMLKAFNKWAQCDGYLKEGYHDMLLVVEEEERK